MEITSTALVSLACLLSSGQTDPQIKQQIVKNLTAEQYGEIQHIINSGAHLPKKFECKIKPGIGHNDTNAAPTTDLE